MDSVKNGNHLLEVRETEVTVGNDAVDSDDAWNLPSFVPDQVPSQAAEESSWASQLKYPSSLDFERVVNQYSIQVTRNRFFGCANQKSNDNITQALIDSNNGGGLSSYSTFQNAQQQQPTIDGLSHQKVAKCRRQPKKRLGYRGRTLTRWVLSTTTGLLTGIMAITIVHCTEGVQEWRVDMMNSLWKNNNPTFAIFLLYATTNLCLALLSAILSLSLAPNAIGSGIPEIKAYLNGVRVMKFTSMSLFLVKTVATILAVSSGLILGPEGPLVHIGAIIGASCTKLPNALLQVLPRACLQNTKLLSFLTMDLSHFSNDAERRDLVSIGAGAGFAAAFGAPIGGLLFSMEEASSFFDHKMLLRTLVATAIATFCLAVYHADLSNFSVISLGEFRTTHQNIFLSRVAELPLYVIVAIGGGILGGIFCRVWKFLQVYKRSWYPARRAKFLWKVVEVASVSLLTSTLLYYLPTMEWSCRPIESSGYLMDADIFDPWANHALQFNCPTGQINELATIFFGSREAIISNILTAPHQFQLWTLLTAGMVMFPLMTLTLGISLPSGIFMPTFLIGTALGGAAGMIFEEWFGQNLPCSTFALLGAAALLAGIQRSTVSLCVILVEGTGQVNVLMPVIVTVVIARYVADKISHHGLYETAIEINQYPYLEHKRMRLLDIFPVSKIMSTPVLTLGPRERSQDLVKLLRKTEHHGFPVVDPKTKKFLGLVRRDQIVALLECEVFEEGEPSEDLDSDSSVRQTFDLGIEETPLMHLAYHIKDDRYSHIQPSTGSLASLPSLAVSKQHDSSDDYDVNAWLLAVRKRRESLTPGGIGDEDLPPMKPAKTNASVIVGSNKEGSIYIKWLNPIHYGKRVDLAAVMNRGTYCVTEFCPVSKAHFLFTAIGLRHLVVLGGSSGGEVVGMLTRVSLLKKSIEERTGCEL